MFSLCAASMRLACAWQALTPPSHRLCADRYGETHKFVKTRVKGNERVVTILFKGNDPLPVFLTPRQSFSIRVFDPRESLRRGPSGEGWDLFVP